MSGNFRDKHINQEIDEDFSEDDVVFDDSDEYEYIEVEDNGEEFYLEEDDDVEYEYVEVDALEDDQDDEEFDEQKFFRGNFPPPPPPMPFYFPPPVIPVENPHFSRNFPPPPIRPMLDPVLRQKMDDAQAEYEEVEIEDNGGEFYPDSAEDENNNELDYDEVVISAAPLASMKSEASDKLLEIGMQQEVIVKNGKFTQFFVVIFKWLLSLIIIGAMIGGCVLIVKSFFDTTSKESGSNIQTREAPKGDFTWRLPFGRTRTCLEEFYRAIGITGNYISAEDLLLKGSITVNGATDDIYCIKKRIDKLVFVKIGIASSARAYAINNNIFGTNVNRLLDGGMSGQKKELSADNARIIRVITYFDDLIFSRAFSKDYNSVRVSNDISYEGEVDVDGVSCQMLSLVDIDSTVVKFFFDNKTSRLYKASYKNKNQLVEVLYSDYKSIDGEQLRPHTRKVFVNSKLYAEIKFDFIVKRDGLIFPN